MWCSTLWLFFFVATMLASTSWAFFVAPPSVSVGFGLPSRQPNTNLASSPLSTRQSYVQNMLLSPCRRLLHGQAADTMEKIQNNTNYEQSLESSAIDIEQQTNNNGRSNNKNGVANFFSSKALHEYETCAFSSYNEDDEIEELFTSLLHKVAKYNAEALVTLSSNHRNDTIVAVDKNNNETVQPISMLRQAYNIARDAHKNQCRKSGEPVSIDSFLLLLLVTASILTINTPSLSLAPVHNSSIGCSTQYCGYAIRFNVITYCIAA